MTSDRTRLNGLRVLVIEDEYLIADDLAKELKRARATVLGPFGMLDEAIRAVEADAAIDAAILDINLHGAMAYEIFDMLNARKVPVVLATGYDREALPESCRFAARCEKPASAGAVLDRLIEILEARPATQDGLRSLPA